MSKLSIELQEFSETYYLMLNYLRDIGVNPNSAAAKFMQAERDRFVTATIIGEWVVELLKSTTGCDWDKEEWIIKVYDFVDRKLEEQL